MEDAEVGGLEGAQLWHGGCKVLMYTAGALWHEHCIIFWYTQCGAR